MKSSLLRCSALSTVLVWSPGAVEAAMLGKSFEQGRGNLVRLLAEKDMHGPSLGYCYADLVEARGMQSGNCREVAERVRMLAEGTGVALPQGERLSPAIRDIITEAWALLAMQSDQTTK
jgi:hypothetical protein